MRYYAVEMRDVMGTRRFYSDSYPNVKLATVAAKNLKREHPCMVVKILKELPRPAGHEFGAVWQDFRTLR